MSTEAEAFERCAARWLTSFQLDLKDFVHVVCDDPDLDDGLRESAAAAVLYTLAPGDVIPDSAGALGYVDDALALRIVLGEVAARAPERFASYRERLADVLGHLDDDLATARAFLGDTYEPFRGRVLATDRIEFKGKRVRDALNDPEWIEEEILLAALKLDFKPADVASASKKSAQVLALFRQKLAPRR